jgi:hypothetical protein
MVIRGTNMCRTRQEVIEEEPEVQKLISLKEKLEAGEVNGFEPNRLYFEVTKLENQIESTIREFIQCDRQKEQAEELSKIRDDTREGFEKHYEFHRKNPSLIALFRKSPTGFLSLGGAGLTATSLLYIKETRDAIFNMVGLESVVGQDILVIGFPLFLFLLAGGIIAFTNAKDKLLLPKQEEE